MRVGGFLSVAIHLGLAAAGMIVAPALTSPPQPMVYIPLELVTIADTTNIAPVQEKAKQADKAEEAAQAENQAAAAPPPPPKDEFVPDASTPPPPKKEADAKTADVKPPAKPKDDDFLKSLNGILSSVDDHKPKIARTATADKAANLRDVSDAGPRKGIGDMKRMTATVTDFIRAQLLAKGCWTDHDDMADARRLRAVIRVRFTRDGHFLEAPRLVDPTRDPSSDPPLQVFIQLARNALDKCNNIGFTVPPEYFQVQPAQYIDIEFLP